MQLTRPYLKLSVVEVFFGFLIFATSNLNAQPSSTRSFNSNDFENVDEVSKGGGNKIGELEAPSSWEFYMSLSILIFSLAVFIIFSLLIYAGKISKEVVLKLFIVTLIISSTLFLIVAGYTNDQIAPAIGLLGTVAGYLLGNTSKQSDHNNQTDA